MVRAENLHLSPFFLLFLLAKIACFIDDFIRYGFPYEVRSVANKRDSYKLRPCLGTL